MYIFSFGVDSRESVIIETLIENYIYQIL